MYDDEDFGSPNNLQDHGQDADQDNITFNVECIEVRGDKPVIDICFLFVMFTRRSNGQPFFFYFSSYEIYVSFP